MSDIDTLKAKLAAEKARADAAEGKHANERDARNAMYVDLTRAQANADREASRAAEMEAQANREQSRADALSCMVVEINAKVERLREAGRDAIREAHSRGIGDGHPMTAKQEGVADIIADFVGPDLSRPDVLSETGRWVKVPSSPWLAGIYSCPSCSVIWTGWGPTTVQPLGSMSCHGM